MNAPIEEIKSKIDIVDFVGSYVRLQKMGSHWKAPCPFHNEKTPSFMVNEERQIWHCFGCSKGGDVFAFLMEIEGIGFGEALKVLADKTGVALPRRSGARDDEPKNRSFEILELATKFYEKQLWDGVGKKASLPYLRDRGLNDEYVRAFRLGYAPDGWRNILDFLTGRGYSPEEVEKAGLAIRKTDTGASHSGSNHYDRFRDRIMFPIMDVLGRVIGYSARVAPGGDESQAKYINTPETSVYRKSHVLYGIQRAKQSMKQSDCALLVEGNMDVIAAHQAGIANTVAVSGTALTKEQLDIIKRYTEHVKLFFDMDGAGQTAARRSTEIALEKGMTVSIVSIPQGKDAADAAKENPDILRAAVNGSVPALGYFLERLLSVHDKNLPEGKRKIAHDYLNLVRFIAHDIDRSFWIRKLSEALDVEERTLFDVLGKAVSESARGSSNASPETKQAIIPTSSFQRRSEFLRRQILGMMLSDASVWEFVATRPTGSEGSFLEEDPLFRMLRDQGSAVGFNFDAFIASIEDQDMRREMTGICFEGTRVSDGMVFIDDAESQAYAMRIAKQYLEDLGKELRKEKMVRLERAMKDAREKGDLEREKLLREEFGALLTGG